MSLKIVTNHGIIDDFTIVLANRSLTHQGQICNVKDFVCKANLNSADEISFTVHKELDDKAERLWDKIVDLGIVWVKELNEYFEICVNISESTSLIKNITGTSLCEAELSQTLLRNIEINSEADIERDDYVVTKFYDFSNPKASLLHRVLEKAPHYSIKHVDESLKNLQRTFSVDGTSIYDFLTGECAEQINCLFQFDSTDRSISVYDLYTVCTSCGRRGEFNDACPKCGSENLYYYGQDTTIFVSSDNLTEEITYETDVDSIKNCFKLEAGDDLMTATVISCNPNGSAYLYYFSETQKQDMPDELVAKLDSYDTIMKSYEEDYQELSKNIYECTDQIIHYTSEMMPTPEISEVTAATEAAKLTKENLSPVGLTSVNSYTSTATVNSALKNFAKVFVKTGYVKVDIDAGNFAYVGADSNGYNYGRWTGRFKVTNYSNEEDVAYSDTITIDVTSDYNYYLTQKVQKNIASNDSDDRSIYNVLSITDLNTFKRALTYYCYNRLESFADAVQGVINLLIEENQSNIDSDYYDEFYLPYYNKLIACQDEMNVRSATIKEYEEQLELLTKQQENIQNSLNFEDYLGEELYTIFCSYRREDTYRNENYISDGLDNAEIFQNAQAFLENAKKEIVKSGEYQHSISSNLYNLLAMKEFESIVDYFELGNWIRLSVDGKIYRLRLVSYEINGSDLTSINTEFSDVTRTASGINDIKSVLSKAQSMATSYSYVAKQASNGDSAQSILKDFTTEGLNSALVNIKNNDAEEVLFDKHGILCKSYDDIEGDYNPEQLRITHNILAYTSDGWKTVSLGLGKHEYHKYIDGVLTADTDYGLSAKFVTAGYINGSQIIGGEIYSQNYSDTSGSYLNLNNGTFSFAGGKMMYRDDSLLLKGANLQIGGTSDQNGTIEVYDENNLKKGAITNTGVWTYGASKSTGRKYSARFYAGWMKCYLDDVEYLHIGDVVDGNNNVVATVSVADTALGLGIYNHATEKYVQKYILSSDEYLESKADTMYDYRHMFSGEVRFLNPIYGYSIYIPSSASSVDTSEYVQLWNSIYGSGRSLITSGGFYAQGDIGCSGTKYRVVSTKHYGYIGMNAFETPEPYFADIGSGTISEIGSTTIFIDTIFAETIDMNSEYQVFITSSSGQVCVKKNYDSFTVYGDAGASFDWMICAKQKDYSAVRMEQVNIGEKPEDEGEKEW